MSIIRFFTLTSIFILFTTSWSQANSAPVNTYSLRVRVPQLEKSCQEEALSLNSAFIAGTGITDVQTECIGSTTLSEKTKTFPVYILILKYKSPSIATSYTAKFSNSLLPSGQVPDSTEGAYNTYSDCIKDIKAQTEFFQTQTKLIPAYASCEPGNSIQDYNYFLQITGFGKKEQSLYVFKLSEKSIPSDVLDVKNLLVQFGAKVSKVIGNQIFYYSKQSINISQINMGTFFDESECSQQLNFAVEIFKGAGAQAVIPRCLSGKELLTSLEVISVGTSMINSNYGFGSENYYSFDECFQDLPRAVRAAREQRPSKPDSVLGGICNHNTNSSGQYNVNIYFK